MFDRGQDLVTHARLHLGHKISWITETIGHGFGSGRGQFLSIGTGENGTPEEIEGC